jgi:hypothetical protein
VPFRHLTSRCLGVRRRLRGDLGLALRDGVAELFGAHVRAPADLELGRPRLQVFALEHLGLQVVERREPPLVDEVGVDGVAVAVDELGRRDAIAGPDETAARQALGVVPREHVLALFGH